MDGLLSQQPHIDLVLHLEARASWVVRGLEGGYECPRSVLAPRALLGGAQAARPRPRALSVRCHLPSARVYDNVIRNGGLILCRTVLPS